MTCVIRGEAVSNVRFTNSAVISYDSSSKLLTLSVKMDVASTSVQLCTPHISRLDRQLKVNNSTAHVAAFKLPNGEKLALAAFQERHSPGEEGAWLRD